MSDSAAAPTPAVEPHELAPPPKLGLAREARIVTESLGLALRLPKIVRTAPKADGEPVLVVPGVATSDAWTAPLRRFLRRLGYRSVGWDLGRNHGRVPDLIPALVERVEERARELGGPLRLIGWSLGGYLAREVARERPELVERVVTLGAPVVGGPTYTTVGARYRRAGYDLDAISAKVAAREASPIQVPVFAVYSRSDGVVAWRACIDPFDTPRIEHWEVGVSHLGMVASTEVFQLVAELLRRPAPAAADTATGPR